ncbi:DUF3102 domain-containing protein [Cyanobacterium aponinum FACHB-4101]|uniref:DUF3102 domain-containing protein n=1 Tax=Cyanobacterium aponinum TaxID=379064 RepID=UPI0016815DEC|nr:DUF3102 domain-containing protein [Cyanobacterium aponinum]MBD2395677.1 DUF3102 domain-containing protein [Cyanobacterium aponinum FACHB-4101]
MPRKKSAITTTENSQLSVFDYSALDANTAKLAKESAIEIKVREKAVWANIIEIGNRLIQVKNALPYGQFESWVKSEFQWNKSTSSRYMKIAEEIKPEVARAQLLPNSFNSLYALASGLSKADEETKEEILTAVESKTEEKGKALTEKEIKEITKEYEEKTKLLHRDLNAVKNENLSMRDKIMNQKTEIQKLSEKLEKQNKQIKELHSDISAKESALNELNVRRADLELKEQELEELISKEANVLAQETLEKERKLIAKKEQELKDQQAKIEKELKEAKSIQREAEKVKDKLKNIDDWIFSLNRFNSLFNESSDRLVALMRSLQNLPDLEVLQGQEREIVNKRIVGEMDYFHDNCESYGKALNNVALLLKKLDSSVLRAIDVEVNK